jgi:hypothetical protein
MLSNEVKLNRTIAELEKAGAYSNFRDKRLEACKENGKPLTITKTLELAESVLETATRTVRKYNGREDNGKEFMESTWPEYSKPVGSINESADNGDPRVALIESYKLTCPELSEAKIRQVLGLAPKGLTRKQAAEFSMAVSCGISRDEAERLAKQS